MEAIAATKPGVSTRTLAKKAGVTTKGQAAAQEAAAKMGAVVVPAGNGGFTLMPKNSAAAQAEVERQRLIDVEKAKLAAESVNSAEEIVDPIPADQKRGAKKPSASARVKATKANREMDAAGTITDAVMEPKDASSDAELTAALTAKDNAQTAEATPAEPVKAKAPYNPAPLSGAAAAGKAPQKGQLPLGLLRALVKRNPNSETLKAALAAAESGATAPAKKAKKAKK